MEGDTPPGECCSSRPPAAFLSVAPGMPPPMTMAPVLPSTGGAGAAPAPLAPDTGASPAPLAAAQGDSLAAVANDLPDVAFPNKESIALRGRHEASGCSTAGVVVGDAGGGASAFSATAGEEIMSSSVCM